MQDKKAIAAALASTIALSGACLIAGCSSSSPSSASAPSNASSSAQEPSESQEAPKSRDKVGDSWVNINEANHRDDEEDDEWAELSNLEAAPVDPSNSTNANGANASRRTPAAAGTKRVGNDDAGYIDVPESWKDRTAEDIGEEFADAASAVYVADPRTRYTASDDLLANAFSSAIQMEAYPTSFRSLADEKFTKYSSGDGYGGVTKEDAVFAGHEAVIVATSIPQDRVLVSNIVFDPKGDSKSCVMITAYATDDTVDAVLGYASTWGEES